MSGSLGSCIGAACLARWPQQGLCWNSRAAASTLGCARGCVRTRRGAGSGRTAGGTGRCPAGGGPRPSAKERGSASAGAGRNPAARLTPRGTCMRGSSGNVERAWAHCTSTVRDMQFGTSKHKHGGAWDAHSRLCKMQDLSGVWWAPLPVRMLARTERPHGGGNTCAAACRLRFWGRAPSGAGARCGRRPGRRASSGRG